MELYKNSNELIKERVADTILSYCAKHGVTQTDFAPQLGFTKPVLSRIVNAQRNLSIDDLQIVASCCGVSLVYLVSGIDVDASMEKKLTQMLGWFTPEEQGVVFDSLYNMAQSMRKMKKIS